MIKEFAILALLSASVVLPSIVFAQIEPPSPPVVNAATTQPTTNTTNKELNLKSLFFSGDDVDAIHRAQSIYEKHKDGSVVDTKGGVEEEDFLNKLEKLSNTKTAPTTFTYPQFFLSSIMYHSPSDWVIWVNNEKIVPSSGVTPSGLRVRDVTAGKVTLEWKPEQMDKVNVVTDNSKEDAIKVDKESKNVTFTLKGNQTFSSYSMQVVEGKVMPITVNLKASEQLAQEDKKDEKKNAEPQDNQKDLPKEPQPVKLTQ